MRTVNRSPKIDDQPHRLDAEERKRLLAEMKEDFDKVSLDPEKFDREMKEREFWDQLAQ